MAITINGSPDQYAPVYNPVEFSVQSNNTAQQNFNFVADVYINSAVTMTARLVFPVYPSQIYGHIDIGGVLKNYLTSNMLTSSATAFAKNGSSILRYDVQWGEQYGASSGITTYPNLSTSSGYAFNGSLEHVNLGTVNPISDWVNWNSSTYTYLNTITYLTNAPRTGISITTTEDYALYFLNTGTNYAYDCLITWYNSVGTLVQSDTMTNSFATVGLYDTRYLRVHVGLKNISAVPITIPASATYYIVYLRDNITAVTSEAFRFNIDTSCSKALRNYRLFFKNRMGGFDAYTFMGQFTRSEETKTETYQALPGTWSGGVFSYSATDRSVKSYKTTGEDTFTCESGWITEKESNWLEELATSPEVYVTYPQSSSTYVPVTIVSGGAYDFKTYSRDKLFNYQVKFKPTFGKVRQQY